MVERLESRVKRLERGVDGRVRVYVTWGDKKADVVDVAPGETVKVVRWADSLPASEEVAEAVAA